MNSENESSPGGDEPEVGGDADQHLRFLESVVSQYESLVEDIHAKLVQSCQTVQSYVRAEDEILPQFHNEYGESSVVQKLQLQLSRKDSIINNLRMQLDVVHRSKNVCKHLWQISLGHVEDLEMSKIIQPPPPERINTSNDNNNDWPSSEFLIKWKTLSSYATSLEEQVEHLSRNLHFYQRKLLQICARYEHLERDQPTEDDGTTMTTKELKRKFEQSEAEVENLRNNFGPRMEKRLAKERASWEMEEAQALRLVRVQVEELLLENQAYQERESQLVVLIQRLDQEFLRQRSQIEMLTKTSTQLQQSLQISKSPRSISGPPESTNIKKVAVAATQTSLSSPILHHHDEQGSVIESTRAQVMQLQRQNLEMQKTERESLERVDMLQKRIRQLESLNFALQKQHQELYTKYDKETKEKSGRGDNKATLLKSFHSPGRMVDRNPEEVKVKAFSEVKAVSPPPTMTTTTNWDIGKVQDFSEEGRIVNDKRKDLQILRLTQDVERLRDIQHKLLEVIQEQSVISSKWKLEFKQLAKATLSSTS
ncbi:intracellular protein transport protein USO1 [Folsomia candida]|uniref:Uncharacterized protein n=1 Tax=Folsomia candida TaxID=158441 RepID=A0A226E0S4_FOLCA|nr:intracellular protein transport protein USO1 [Folsomia candida]OXA50624.1 hypothetical protein Fcan01_14547 [Folsomia candida]